MGSSASGAAAPPRPGRRPRDDPRAGLLPAVSAGIALVIAACGSGSAAIAGSGARWTTYQKELGYAQCMRAHGLPSFPDPQSDGTFNSTRANANDFFGPRFQPADQVCAHLGGPPVTAAQQQQGRRPFLRYASCMRAHGIANFPDPGGHCLACIGPGDGIGSQSPQYLSAQQACRSLLPSGGQ
jgi:hypothetical protein